MPGQILINPDVINDKRDALAVAWNEALRILMEDIGFEPEFDITPEQEEFFRGTAYAEGEGTSAEKGGNVLGKLDPATWGGSGGKTIMRADTRTYRELHPPTELRSTLPTPLEAANEAVGNQIPSDNPAVNLVNQFIAGAGKFGMARAVSPGGRVVVAHEFEGREISAGRAKLLREHTQRAEQSMRLRAAEMQQSAQQREGGGGIVLRKATALDHHTAAAGPQNFTYDPGRAYRRVGGIEGLRDLVDMGGLMPHPTGSKKNPLGGSSGPFGRKVFFKAGHPEIAYSGPITVEMNANADTAPGRYEKKADTKRFSGFIHAESGEGLMLQNVSRILHDDGSVIYSRERDGFSGLLPVVNSYLAKNGARTVGSIGEGRPAREAAIAASEEAQRQQALADAARASKSGLTERLKKR
jgi:hypothetical protein